MACFFPLEVSFFFSFFEGSFFGLHHFCIPHLVVLFSIWMFVFPLRVVEVEDTLLSFG